MSPRRLFVLALAMGSLVGASAATPQPYVRAPAARPVVIGVFGDSLGDGLWAGLSQQLRDGGTY